MSRPIPAAAVAMNRFFEGLQLAAYPDGAEEAIGYGHDDPGLKPGDTETEAQADADNLDDLAKAGARVTARIGQTRTDDLSDGQWGALVDFAYNAGASPDEPIWAHVVTAPQLVPEDLAQRVTNRAGVALGGLILRRQWEAAMWSDEGEPTFTPPGRADYAAARAKAAALNAPPTGDA